MGGPIRLLLLAFALWLVMSGVRRLLSPPSLPRRGRGEEKGQEGVLLLQDPQCGRFVFEREAVKASFHGQVFYFCSQQCCDLYARSHVTPPRH